MNDLINFGKTFCHGLVLYFSNVLSKKAILKESQKEQESKSQALRTNFLEELYASNENVIDIEDSGSDSQASEDNMPISLLKGLLPEKKEKPKKLVKRGSLIPVGKSRYLEKYREKIQEERSQHALSASPTPHKNIRRPPPNIPNEQVPGSESEEERYHFTSKYSH